MVDEDVVEESQTDDVELHSGLCVLRCVSDIAGRWLLSLAAGTCTPHLEELKGTIPASALAGNEVGQKRGSKRLPLCLSA